MRLAVAFCLTLAIAIVESRPSALPADVPKPNVKQSVDNAIDARGLGDVLHNALNKQSSGSDATSTVSTSSSATSSDASTTTAVKTSSSSASATSSSTLVSSSPSSETTTSATLAQTPSPSTSSTSSTPSSSPSAESPSATHLSLGSLLGGGLHHKGSEDAEAETYGNDEITTYHSLGTTGDRVGFSWVPVGSSD